jgi:lipopolysaccharide/colanic/teichoic acid biosynthesis glycosyltransferase
MDKSHRQPSATYRIAKRGVDIVGAAIGLVVVAPLLLACAVWIRMADNGPVIYSQWRVGHNGWLFRIYKLRTMKIQAEAPGSARFASNHDDRIIRGGRLLRRSHVDELPQLWNVLKGEMSLVGPRPERPEMIEILRADLPRIERRLEAKPGLTGLAQLRNGYTNDVAGARRKQAWDLRYLRRRSVMQEFRLILMTFPRLWDRAAL